jgi:transposase
LGEDNPVRAIDVFVDELDLAGLGFGGVEPEATGRPACHPATLLKIYVYGYLSRVQSNRRLERECQRNIELVWLTGRLKPDFKTIADFRKDNGEAIRRVCREFVVLCRRLELFSEASVAIDGSKFKAVNTRDRNFTQAKMQRRLAQIDESIERGATAASSRAGHAATHGQPDAPKQIAADSVDAVERGHDISCTVDPGHCSGARYERAAKHRSRHRLF